MALSVNAKALAALPSNLEGLYLFPYEWFCYGIEHGHLEVEDLDFYDTIQGSIYLALESHNVPKLLRNAKEETWAPIWYVYRSGSGEVTPSVDQGIYNGDRLCAVIEDSHFKSPICCITIDEMRDLPKNDQKTVNNSIIQLFKGCRIKLKHSVWF